MVALKVSFSLTKMTIQQPHFSDIRLRLEIQSSYLRDSRVKKIVKCTESGTTLCDLTRKSGSSLSPLYAFHQGRPFLVIFLVNFVSKNSLNALNPELRVVI
jgi:hypothetical protein